MGTISTGRLFSADRQSNAPFSRRFPGKLPRPACGNPLPGRETFFEYQGLALSRLAFPALRRDANISPHDVWRGAFQSRKSPRNGGWIGSVKQLRLTLSQRGAAHKRSTITVLYGCPLTDQFLRRCRQISNPPTTTKRRMRSTAGLYKSVIRRGANTPIRSST